MHLMYVDESGDPGFSDGSSTQFVRVGVVVHGWQWRAVDERIRTFKLSRGLDWNTEIRATDIRRGRRAFSGRPRRERETLLVDLLDTIGRECPELVLIGVCIDKARVDRTRAARWSNPAVRSVELLLEAYTAYLGRQKDRCGIVVLDECEGSNDANIRYFQNYLRRYSDRIDAQRIVEGTFFLPSGSSNLLQIADVCANVLLRRIRDDDESRAEWARIRGKFFAVREWPVQ